MASASKSITAQTLLLLAADGKLSLDAPIGRWLPQVTSAGDITVRELLEHVSGLPDHYPQTYPAGPRSAPITADRIIAEWGGHPLLFAPGTRFRYSNLNYVVAGRIAELASGEPLFTLQQRRIFTPFGMTGVVDLDRVTRATPNLATGYVRTGLGPLEPAPDEGPGWSFGAGQIVATASDLARWDMALLAGKPLPSAQAREEVTPPVLANGERSPYALGLFVSRKSGRLVWSHVGQGLGFLAGNSIYPDDGTAIVVLTSARHRPDRNHHAMTRHGSPSSRRAAHALPARTPLAPTMIPLAPASISSSGAGRHRCRTPRLASIRPPADGHPDGCRAHLTTGRNPKSP